MKTVLFIILVGSVIVGNSQTWVTDDSKNSILDRSTNILIDLGKEEARFNLNNVRKMQSTDVANSYLLGFEMNAKDASKKLSVFDKGYFNLKSSMHMMGGFYFSNADKDRRPVKTDHSDRYKELQDSTKQLKELFKNAVDQAKVFVKLEKIDDPITRRNTKDKLEELDYLDFFFSHFSETPLAILEKLKEYEKEEDDKIVKNMWKDATHYYQDVIDENYKPYEEVKKKYDAFRKNDTYHEEKYYRAFIIFGTAGFTGESFKHYAGNIDTTNVSNSFSKEGMRGGGFGLGLNYRYRGWTFGLKYDYQETSNFGDLDKEEYTLANTVAAGTGSVKVSETFDAYEGNYYRLYKNQISFDVMKFIKLKNFKEDPDPITLGVGAYFRYNEFNRRKYLEHPPTTDMGIACNFFKEGKKFLGGFYLGAIDINNHLQQGKEDPDDRDLVNRLSFGMHANFLLSTILSPKELKDK